MMRDRRLILGGLIVWISFGCGGGGGGGSSTGGDSLSGTVSTTNFTIPAGTTKTVTGNFSVHATGTIEIDGTLLIPSGVKVALVSDGPLNIKGKIAPTTTPAKALRTTATGEGTLTGSGTTIIASGGITTPLGTNVLIATNGAGTVDLTGVVTANGADSTSQALPGGDGGNLEVGTQAAIETASQAGAKNSQAPSTIEVGIVNTGKGGLGFNDQKGINDGSKVTFGGSQGGNGGNVTLVATESIVVSDSVQAGAGGDGGQCTGVAPPQTGYGKKGINVVATTGDGGNGGSISLSPAATGGSIKAGHGGFPGSARVQASDGGSPAGAGGDATVTSGDRGQDGTGAPVVSSKSDVGYGLLAGKGLAGIAAVPKGGDGGNVVLQNKKGAAAFTEAAPATILPGSGGAGWDGCTSAVGGIAGGDGGDAGGVTVHGLAYTLKEKVTAGNGGDGEGPGAAGICPLDDSGQTVGSDGTAGTFCKTNAPIVIKTVKMPVDDASYESLDPSSHLLICSSASLTQPSCSVMNTSTYVTSMVSCPNAVTDINGSVANGNTMTRGGSVYYVSSSAGRSVYIFDEATGAKTGSITASDGVTTTGPYAIAYEPTTQRLYVSVQDAHTAKGIVEIYDTAHSNNLIGTIATDAVASSMALNSGVNRLYLDNYSTQQLSVVDTSGLTQVRTVTLPDNSGVVSVNPKTDKVYVTLFNTSKLLVMSQNLDQTLATITVGSNPWGIGVDSTRGRVFVANYNYSSSGPQQSTVTEVDAVGNTVMTTINVGKSATGIAVDETGDLIYVANASDSTISVINGN